MFNCLQLPSTTLSCVMEESEIINCCNFSRFITSFLGKFQQYFRRDHVFKRSGQRRRMRPLSANNFQILRDFWITFSYYFLCTFSIFMVRPIPPLPPQPTKKRNHKSTLFFYQWTRREKMMGKNLKIIFIYLKMTYLFNFSKESRKVLNKSCWPQNFLSNRVFNV